MVAISVVDPNSKYIEFGSGSKILVQFGSGSSVMLSILKEKIKIIIILEKKFPFKKYNNYLPFYLHFILYLHLWIRIRIGNPDPESS